MPNSSALPVVCVAENGLEQSGLSDRDLVWARANGFLGQRGKLLPLPDAAGGLDGWAFGTGAKDNRSVFVAGLAGAALPEGRYRLEGEVGDATLSAIAFRLGAYRFEQYKKSVAGPELELFGLADAAEVNRQVEAATLARDLINMPANDLGPDALEKRIREFAAGHKMKVKVIAGDDLIKQRFPLIHAVGRASAQAPRLVDLTWGKAADPKVTLVGKGVTFDTGGLDIKSATGMLLMKKDMGGAANVLGLAHAIMSAKLPVRLRVLIPVVENAISGSAFRPGDVLRSRKGFTVEIGNTDAEGRLILADALALADEEAPDFLLDMATLTGAARVALGPELSPLYCTDDRVAATIVEAGRAAEDPFWTMPLWPGYDAQLNSRIADMNNTGSGGHSGSIVAALFLRRFVTNAAVWTHLDIFGWTNEARPGRPIGGTDQGIRAIYGLLRQRYPA